MAICDKLALTGRALSGSKTPGRTAKDAGKCAREVVDIGVAHQKCELFEGLIGTQEQCPGAVQSGTLDIGRRADSHPLGDAACEMAR